MSGNEHAEPNHPSRAEAGAVGPGSQPVKESVPQTENQADEQETLDQKPRPKRRRAAGGILPKKASEDDPRRWGDEPDDDRDAWLREQRPPHWG
ncbi:hypothetical protein [Arthrobacter sp. NyZ413]|uniref:hypothetical protein n=1 Tax=Arthrobacter sp. NyZ413 TaxID=3144669 RepID=UPI003BF89091